MSHRPFIVVGDAMLDVSVRLTDSITALAHASDTPAHISTQPGGSAANTAAWLAWQGFPVTFGGCLGDDHAATLIRGALDDLGVASAIAVVEDRPTGTCVALVEPDGERTMMPDRGANTRLADAVPAIARRLIAGTHLHLSGYAILGKDTREAASEILRQARALDLTTSIDCSSASPLEAARDAFVGALGAVESGAGVDVLLANEAEADVLGGFDGMLSLARCAVIKRGAEPAEVRAAPAVDARGSHDTVIAVRRPEAIDVVDATGAGDAFAAGFLPAWLDGSAPGEALERGHALAARACTRVGAGPPPP